MFLRALDTKPLFGRLANFLPTPLGCIKGHLAYFKLSNSNTFSDRAQQFSSCKTITISGQKVKINIMKWVSLSLFLSAVNAIITTSLRIYMKTCRFLAIPRLCKLQFSKGESKPQPVPPEELECSHELCTMPWRAAGPRWKLIHWIVLNVGKGLGSGPRHPPPPRSPGWRTADDPNAGGLSWDSTVMDQRPSQGQGFGALPSLSSFTGTPPCRGHLATLGINLPTHKPDGILKVGATLS